MFFIRFFFISLLASGIHSVDVVKNLTVSDTLISERFIRVFRDNQNFHPIKPTTESDRKCLSAFEEIIRQLPSEKVISFFDAWGHLPSGIHYGNTYDIGNFDQCVNTSITLNDPIGVVDGQYCVLRIPIRERDNTTIPETWDLNLNLGICVPDSCSADYLPSILNFIGYEVYGAVGNVTVSHCKTGKTPPYKAINIVGVCVFSFFGGLMLLSTLYDFFMTYLEKTPVPVLLAFSVLTNAQKMFAISTKKSPNNIDCLTGIRVLSMAWIVYGHTYMITTSQTPVINDVDKDVWKKTFIYLQVANATFAVDTFFFLSGLLVAWSGFRELDRTKGKLNVVMMYVHRYIRLTPLVAAVMLIIYSLDDIVGTGPFRDGLSGSGDKCNSDNWWPNLLYIQNYYISDPPCLSRSWYLAVDFQLYIVSPLLLIPMWKWGKKFAPVLVALVLMSIAYIMTIYITRGFTNLEGGNPKEWTVTYIPMHTRCSPWLVGFGLGYFMHISRQRTFRLKFVFLIVAWALCFFTMMATVFGTYFSIQAYGKGTVFETAMYDGWKRCVWSIAIGWITFACHNGFGGSLNTFFSHPFWQPLARLTYSMYLMHALVIRLNASLMRTHVYFSTYEEILRFWSGLGVSVVLSIAMSLAFEGPILVLEKFIFGDGKAKKPKPVEQPPTLSKEKIEVF